MERPPDNPEHPASSTPGSIGTRRRFSTRTALVLAVLLLLAGLLRFAQLNRTPPGLHVDAAANAWNAWCLLETGQDFHGEPWPLFYTETFGENRTTLFLYALIPFQAVGGLSPLTTRLPNAVAGLLTLILLAWVAARLFDVQTGLIAAGMLALNPWHLFLSRTGHEAGWTPLLVLAPLALMLHAGLPLGDPRKSDRVRVWAAFLAGALAGICCYGYLAVRLFLPLFLALLVLASLRDGWAFARRHAAATLAAAAGLLLTAGPLLLRHLTDPAANVRLEELGLWNASVSAGGNLLALIGRYLEHFSLRFLFFDGDTFPLHWLAGSAPFQLYQLPLMALGAGALLAALRWSRSARLVLIWVLVYPLVDSFSRHESGHLLRSAPGLCGMLLLGAVGLRQAALWSGRISKPWRRVAVVLLVVAVVASNARFLQRYFGGQDRAEIHALYNADLLEAWGWVGERLADYDAVFSTVRGNGALQQDFVISLVGMRYAPQRWFDDEKETCRDPNGSYIRRYGTVGFLFDRTFLSTLARFEITARKERVLFIIRDGEVPLPNPVHTIHGPDGQVALRLHELQY